jgi:hypothetical protein
LIEQIVCFAQRLTPIALIGAGGIGKTSTILTVLHDDRIKQQFGDNRRFIRCDQFPPSHTHFLRRLSKAIGADIENPEDLTPLRRYLSSKKMIIVLDNAESILDPQGTSAEEIYASVDELTRFSNICLCITSRISIIPPDCEILEIPPLSMEAARETFHRIYKHGRQSDPINEILERLDFHPLSVTLLATVAQHSKWDTKRLTREWERQRTGVLRAQNSRSLATTIELSLSSPMFRELGPDARELLGVIAFLPQGVDEENIDWLFPTIFDGPNMFDTFCILSLTHRSNGFITMLAPLRDYLRPKDPMSSLLLGATKECYFSRLSTYIDPDEPGFEESRWIVSEDVNIEHLLDVFTSIDTSSQNIWDVCADFTNHLYWHKPRPVTLGPKVEALPDDHLFKPRCLLDLARLSSSVGNWVEYKRLVIHAVKLWRERGDDDQVAQGLRDLSRANWGMGLYKEGIQQAREASEICERLGDTAKQAECLIILAYVLLMTNNSTAQKNPHPGRSIFSRRKANNFSSAKVTVFLAIYMNLRAIRRKPSTIWRQPSKLHLLSTMTIQLFWIHYALADLTFGQGRFDDAHAHIEHAKSHTINDVYQLGRAMELQADFWWRQRMFEKARVEASRAADVYEKLGATKDLGECRELLDRIDEEMNSPVVSDESDVDGELLETLPLPACINVSPQGQEAK